MSTSMTTTGESRPAKVVLKDELAKIFDARGGVDGLPIPLHVVEAASDPAHPLHGRFVWDDALAAHHQRLLTAAALIRTVKVTFVHQTPEGPKDVRIRLYHSLPEDRKRGGGYRTIDEILADPELRAQKVRGVLRDLAALRRQYVDLVELTGVWEAIDRAAAASEPPASAPVSAPAEAG